MVDKKVRQLGFGHLVLLLIVVVVVAIGFVGWQVVKKHSSGQYNSQGSSGSSGSSRSYAVAGDGGDSSAKDLPACSGTAVLNHSPTSDVATIEGLGHMYGEHILPAQADHVYLYPNSSDNSVNVYAPGNVTLVQVAAQKHTSGADVGLGTDYTLFFSPCKSVMFDFIHVKTVSATVQKAMDAAKPNCSDSGTLASNCIYADLSLKLNSGDIMGTALGGNYGTDFAGTDVRTPTLAYLNKNDYIGGALGDSYTHTVCPLDYFTSSVKSQLYGKINIKNAGTNGIPACGSVMQDKVGTSQGNWYMPGIGYTSQNDNITKILALAHSNIDPSQAVISAGTKLLPSTDFGSQISYQPRSNGYINRDPADITPDGHVYCIEGQVSVVNKQGHVDLQMADSSTLKASYADGDCATSPALGANAVTYNR